MPARECSRTACTEPAVSTLTYVYADSTIVLGPLSATSEPHSYDLCREHAAKLTGPRGWRVIRVPGAAQAVDDLVAIAQAVRDRSPEEARPVTRGSGPSRASEACQAAPRQAPSGDRAPAHRRTDTGRHLSAVPRTHDSDEEPQR